ncbi:uncharacterized protein LOC116617241 [Nematostella vectensis]|uniref:uncharacterized protein LOC116617241 n=1 Tax=Nematostella vectensis TaxID=45351 RepID=UPI0020770D96|nr:uncharacterized protein LOC116617241 [Nematostella vectensis]
MTTRKKSLLENYAHASFDELQEKSAYPETLTITEFRQYRNRGLSHISDATYLFFLDLEQERVQLLNIKQLHDKGERLVKECIDELLSNTDLRRKWYSLFPLQSDDKILGELYTDVITRYAKMGAGQFLRDYRLAMKIAKTNAHRVEIKKRKKRKECLEKKVPMAEMEKDSGHKRKSHARLVVLAGDGTDLEVFCPVYLKIELTRLCKAYEIPTTPKTTKKQMSEALVQKIPSLSAMPSPSLLNNYIVQTANEGLNLTIRRV